MRKYKLEIETDSMILAHQIRDFLQGSTQDYKLTTTEEVFKPQQPQVINEQNHYPEGTPI
jgi:hypothetical protein